MLNVCYESSGVPDVKHYYSTATKCRDLRIKVNKFNGFIHNMVQDIQILRPTAAHHFIGLLLLLGIWHGVSDFKIYHT